MTVATPDQLARVVLAIAVVLTPSVIVAGPVYGFDIPKLAVIALTMVPLAVLVAGMLPALWTQQPLVGRVVLAAAGGFAGWVVLATLVTETSRLSILGPDGRFVGTLAIVGPVVLTAGVPLALRTRRQVDRGLQVLAAMLVLLAGYAVVQAVGLDPMPWAAAFGGRPVGTFGNSNFVGAALSVGVVVAVWLWLRRPSQRVWAVLLAVVTVIALWRSEARLGWVSALGGLLSFAALYLPLPKPGWDRVQGWLVAALPVAAPLLGFAAVGAGIAISDTTSLARLGYWRAAVPMWADNLLVGVGPGRFQAFHRAYRPPASVIEGGRDIPVDSSHSWLLDIAATAGSPAAVLWIVLLIAVGLLLRGAYLATDGQDRLLVVTITALLATHGVQSSISVPTVAPVWMGWLLIGGAVAVATVVTHPDPDATIRRSVGARRRRSTRRSTPKRRTIRIYRRDAILLAVALLATVATVGPVRAVWVTSQDLGSGFALRSAERFDDALQRHQQAVERAPWWPETWRTLAQAAVGSGDPQRARTALDQALDADPRDRVALLQLADLTIDEEGPAAAEVWFDRLRELDPVGLDLHLDVAAWALTIGRPDLAREALDVAELTVTPELSQWDRYQQLRAAS